MSEIRPRTATTHWSNKGPITDLHEALDLLTKNYYDTGVRYLYRGHKLAHEGHPEIFRDWWRDGGSGGENTADTYYLQIDPELAKQLIADELVVPMQIPHSGFTETLQDKLVLSPTGSKKREDLHEEKRALAESILKSKTDSKPSSTFYDAGHGRVYGRWGGELFFGFKTPMSVEWRVYPNSGEVKRFDRHGKEIKQPEKQEVLLDATENDN